VLFSKKSSTDSLWNIEFPPIKLSRIFTFVFCLKNALTKGTCAVLIPW
jgi:hypothetical protein